MRHLQQYIGDSWRSLEGYFALQTLQNRDVDGNILAWWGSILRNGDGGRNYN